MPGARCAPRPGPAPPAPPARPGPCGLPPRPPPPLHTHRAWDRWFAPSSGDGARAGGRVSRPHCGHRLCSSPPLGSAWPRHPFRCRPCFSCSPKAAHAAQRTCSRLNTRANHGRSGPASTLPRPAAPNPARPRPLSAPRPGLPRPKAAHGHCGRFLRGDLGSPRLLGRVGRGHCARAALRGEVAGKGLSALPCMAALCLPVPLPQQRLEWEPTRGEHLVGNSCFSPDNSL